MTVRIWDTSTDEGLATLRRDQGGARSAALGPESTRLASTTYDETVRVWDTLPYRVRYQERQAVYVAQPEAQRIVVDLWQEYSDWKTIAQRLREDKSLTNPLRRAALNLDCEVNLRDYAVFQLSLR